MAKKGRGGKKRGRQQFKRLGAPKRGGSRAKKGEKIHALLVSGSADVWKAQDALRKDGYFARAVGPKKIVTNAPVKRL